MSDMIRSSAILARGSFVSPPAEKKVLIEFPFGHVLFSFTTKQGGASGCYFDSALNSIILENMVSPLGFGACLKVTRNGQTCDFFMTVHAIGDGDDYMHLLNYTVI